MTLYKNPCIQILHNAVLAAGSPSHTITVYASQSLKKCVLSVYACMLCVCKQNTRSEKIFLVKASPMSLAVTVASTLYGSFVFKENTSNAHMGKPKHEIWMLSKAITILFTNDFRNFIIKYYVLGESKCSQHTLKCKHGLRDMLIRFFFIRQCINVRASH